MKTRTLLSVAAVLSTLALRVLAQVGGPGPMPPRPGQPPMGGIGGMGRAQGIELPPLKTRDLENKALDSREQKKYDAQVASVQKRTAGGGGRAANPATELAGDFQLAAKQLSFAQEKDAEDTLKSAWGKLPAMMEEPRMMMAALGQVRSHLQSLRPIMDKDPSLVLALMVGLSDAHKAAFDAIENPKQRPQLAGLIAATWFQLMQLGQLEPDASKKAAEWIILAPQMAVADRPLLPEQRSEYQEQLTHAIIDVNNKLLQLARRQSGQGGPGMNSADGGQVDPAVMAMFEGKSAAIARFMEAEVHFRWGQFRQGEAASQEGWKELLGYYRTNARNASPVDVEVHLNALGHLNRVNPVQEAILLSDLDAAYRNMTQVDRLFGARVADEWIRLASSLPLNAVMLERTLSWVEYAAKQGQGGESKYASAAEAIKTKLEEARKTEGIGDKSRKGEKRDDDAKEAKERGETERSEAKERPDSNEPKRTTGPRGINIPKPVDATKQ